MIRYKDKKLLIFFLFLTQIVFYVFSLGVNTISTITILILIQFILALSCLLLQGNSIFSFPVIYFFLTFVFHVSYFVLIILGFSELGNVPYFFLLSESARIEALRVCFLFFLGFPLGIVFFRGKKPIKRNVGLLNLRHCEYIGKWLILLCLLPRIYVDYKYLIAYITGGYGATFRVGINNYLEILADGFFIGIILSIIGNKDKSSKAKLYLILSIVFIVIGMLSGRRQEKIAYLIIVFFIYINYVDREKINILRIFRIYILLFLIVALLATLGDLRTTGILSIDLFLKYYIRNITFGLLFDQLAEFGYAVYTLGASIEFFSRTGFGYGLNYILGWIQVLPNVFGILNGFTDKLNFVMQLPDQYQYSLGGSIIGESFYNFGYYSFFFSFFLGGIINHFAIHFDSSIKSNMISTKGLLFLLSLSGSILWIRGNFNYLPRTIVWYFVVILLMRNLLFTQHMNLKHEI